MMREVGMRINQEYKLVPVEPTEEMVDAVLPLDRFTQDQRDCLVGEYKTMLAAAPVIEQEPIGEMREIGVVWFDKNPHAFPLGTKYYTTPQPCSRCEELSVDVWEQKRCQDAMEGKLAALEAQQAETIKSYEEVAEDKQRLVSEIDVILNGEEGLAKRPSLCDVVHQIRDKVTQLAAAEAVIEISNEICKTLEHPTNAVNAMQMWRLREAITAYRKGKK